VEQSLGVGTGIVIADTHARRLPETCARNLHRIERMQPV